MKPLLMSSALCATLLLSACGSSGSNPLLTQKKEKAMAFLRQAEGYASQKTHVYYASGSVYVTCMVNPKHFDNPFIKDAKNPCQDYVKTMLDVPNKPAAFKGLRYSQLISPSVTKRLGTALDERDEIGG